MHCNFCGFANNEHNHRCSRCGRRIGVAIAAPQNFAGANALALKPVLNQTVKNEIVQTFEPPAQTVLFPPSPSNVIPFDQIQRQAGLRAVPHNAPGVPNTPLRANIKKAAVPTAEQTKLDFIPAAAPKSRTLKTEVEAVIFCDQLVATPMHRFVAALIDAAVVLFAFAVFVTLSLGLGGSFGEGKLFWIAMAACFAVISLFYGSIWALLGTESVGMRCTELQLITFDGFPLEGSARMFRFAATGLSFCSAGLGVLWSLVDEENLTWHDHISKTFPTVREVPRNFVRQRR